MKRKLPCQTTSLLYLIHPSRPGPRTGSATRPCLHLASLIRWKKPRLNLFQKAFCHGSKLQTAIVPTKRGGGALRQKDSEITDLRSPPCNACKSHAKLSKKESLKSAVLFLSLHLWHLWPLKHGKPSLAPVKASASEQPASSLGSRGKEPCRKRFVANGG